MYLLLHLSYLELLELIYFFGLPPTFFMKRISKSDILKFVLCGLFGVTANQLMFFTGLELTSTIHASIIMVTSPIIVSILSLIILKEKLQIHKIFGIIIGLIGAVIIISENNSISGNSGLNGDIFFFKCNKFWSILNYCETINDKI